MQATEKLIARNFKLSKRSCIRYGNNSTRNDWISESIMQLCGKRLDRKNRKREENQAKEKMIARKLKATKKGCKRYGKKSTKDELLRELIIQISGKKSDRKRRL